MESVEAFWLFPIDPCPEFGSREDTFGLLTEYGARIWILDLCESDIEPREVAFERLGGSLA